MVVPITEVVTTTVIYTLLKSKLGGIPSHKWIGDNCLDKKVISYSHLVEWMGYKATYTTREKAEKSVVEEYGVQSFMRIEKYKLRHDKKPKIIEENRKVILTKLN